MSREKRKHSLEGFLGDFFGLLRLFIVPCFAGLERSNKIAKVNSTAAMQSIGFVGAFPWRRAFTASETFATRLLAEPWNILCKFNLGERIRYRCLLFHPK